MPKRYRRKSEAADNGDTLHADASFIGLRRPAEAQFADLRGGFSDQDGGIHSGRRLCGERGRDEGLLGIEERILPASEVPQGSGGVPAHARGFEQDAQSVEETGDPVERASGVRTPRRVRASSGKHTRLLTVDYRRQEAIFDPTKHESVEITIAGCGNIGSHAALALARLGLKKFHIFDFDNVEMHNLSSQAYPMKDVGKPKVDSLKTQMLTMNPNAEVTVYNQPFTGKEQVGGILISAVDSMEIRRSIAENVPEGTYVVDGRMGGGQIEVWSQPSEKWGATLTRDGDTDPCSARYISYTSTIIGGLIANQVKRHILGQRIATRILMHVDTLELIVEKEPLPATAVAV